MDWPLDVSSPSPQRAHLREQATSQTDDSRGILADRCPEEDEEDTTREAEEDNWPASEGDYSTAT